MVGNVGRKESGGRWSPWMVMVVARGRVGIYFKAPLTCMGSRTGTLSLRQSVGENCLRFHPARGSN